jgi:DNA repair exonuclease SbcCD ATPase subunit
MAIESLMQQAGTFVDALTVKPAATTKTGDDAAQEARAPEQGDTVTISEEARALAAMEKSGDSHELDQEKDMDQTIDSLKKRIQKLEEETKAIEDGDLPEDRKQLQLQEKEAMLMDLRDQLLKAEQTKLKVTGMADGGGTRAKGFGNSAENF